MYERIYTSRFKKDLRRAEKRGKDLTLLKTAIDILAEGKQLAAEYSDHPLKGDYKGYRECHIEPDWLLIYKIDKGVLVLLLHSTGTHADLLE